MSPPEMSGQPLSKNILQVLLLGGGKYLKAYPMRKQKLFENKAFKALMESKICLVMLLPVIRA